jgi:hypothetical protein
LFWCVLYQRQVAAAQLTDNSNNPSASHHGLQAGHNHLVSPKVKYCGIIYYCWNYCAGLLNKLLNFHDPRSLVQIQSFVSQIMPLEGAFVCWLQQRKTFGSEIE